GQPIGEREREILTAIVETFIATGDPVGSRTLARSNKEGLSPATIRNVMADLADAGYLEQPHTSAGRVPSASAYRYYVEQLSGKTQLSQADEGMIQDSLQGVTDVQEFMERTSHVLSLISRNVGVAVAASGPKNALEHAYCSRLGELKALDEKQRLVELLGAYLDAKQEAVRVVIGLDEAQPSMRNLVLIGTPARVGGEVMGSLAVLGPPRMDYQHTITAVSYIARLFDKVLNESE